MNLTELAGDKIERLINLGFDFGKTQIENDSLKWFEFYEQLKMYKTKNGNCKVPTKNYIIENLNLSQWVKAQRKLRVDNRLSSERYNLLERLGFIWDVREIIWESGFDQLKAYAEKHGDCLVSRDKKDKLYNGFALSTWVRIQRNNRKSGKISEERIRRLDAIGFVWDQYAYMWDEGCKHYESFISQKNRRQLRNGTVFNGFKLGQWAGTQRRIFKEGKMSPDRERRLSQLGFIWSYNKND